ncbi:uncharacterized protein BO97DRAFT_409268 [Aspergillus homomorphus CBS 101889]|uniref:Uncharacterized protein n=1 Tax=Aspergillus homomorphus (strain CBS 101889) TaxID=1450537 RepID=A0A395HH42_ASPHC|nr:hypothetical protein BO97DRAFT_409268 [Aspergillus homomorphus CBS 101889]RAL07080.1 hypothetical protein BO97DRAFT_409268 [Aspergillus homomorphus CBS 101889]
MDHGPPSLSLLSSHFWFRSCRSSSSSHRNSSSSKMDEGFLSTQAIYPNLTSHISPRSLSPTRWNCTNEQGGKGA